VGVIRQSEPPERRITPSAPIRPTSYDVTVQTAEDERVEYKSFLDVTKAAFELCTVK
jgi:hypothetical protein